MSTPEQPLTRKQMREVLRTGAIPIIRSAQHSESDAAAASAERIPSVPAVPPIPDSEVDLDAVPLTRREARQQERLRTASVPIISPEFAAAALAAGHEAKQADAEAETEAWADAERDDAAAGERERAVEDERVLDAETDSSVDVVLEVEVDVDVEMDENSGSSTEVVDDAAEVSIATVVEGDAESTSTPAADALADADADEVLADDVAAGSDHVSDAREFPEVVEADSANDPEADGEATKAEPEEEPVVAIHSGFGGHLLLDDPQIVAPMPASFDQLVGRGSTATGSATATNALILSQTPTSAPLGGAVTATGEILITGMLNLPEGLGSTGHDARHADGKEIDALLVDGGELPASSSPTPVAASSAISTIKSAGEIIKPPVPEKGSRLMFTLAITAGVLALALVGVLILGFITGAL